VTFYHIEGVYKTFLKNNNNLKILVPDSPVLNLKLMEAAFGKRKYLMERNKP